MLEENTYPDIVSWSPKGDCFVIKELDAFTKTILPRMFKHSNFASFVRQLNKYDFHKVRSPFVDPSIHTVLLLRGATSGIAREVGFLPSVSAFPRP